MRDIPDGFLKMIEDDIEEINREISTGSPESRFSLHRKIDAHYQACISHWYDGLWGSNDSKTSLYYSLLEMDNSSVIQNLEMMRSKLETYRFQMNAVSPSVPSTQVNVTTNVNVDLTFQEAKNRIEDLTTLSQTETDEINQRIDELEAISKESISRKRKWEKVKPIISFALDKGADVAIMILGLVMQMKLGM